MRIIFGSLLLFSFLCDICMALFMPQAVVVFRIIAFFVFFCWFFCREGLNYRDNIFIYLFFVYTCALLPFSGNFARSLAMQANIFIPLFAYIAGLRISKGRMKDIGRYAFFILPLFIINTAAANILGKGYAYDGSVAFGAIIHSYLYAPAFVLVLLPYIIDSYEKKWVKWMAAFTGIFGFILLVLSMRRMAIIIVMLGYIIYFAVGRKINCRYLILAVLAVIILFPLYKGLLYEQVEARGWVFEKNYSIKDELRYQETIDVWKEALSFREPVKSLFGREIWNSRGNYAGGKFGERTIHSDYNLILHGAGFAGLLLYMGIFADILLRYLRARKNISDSRLRALFIALFILSFIVSVAGRMNFVTFRFIIFACLGGILAEGKP